MKITLIWNVLVYTATAEDDFKVLADDFLDAVLKVKRKLDKYDAELNPKIMKIELAGDVEY